MNHVEYTLGLGGGFVFGLLLVGVMKTIYNKRHGGTCQYDERQKLAQLKAWRAAFFAAVGFSIVYGAAVDTLGQWGSMSMMSFCSLFVGIGTCVAVCIVKDAYTPLHRSAGKYMLLFLGIALFNGVLGYISGLKNGFVENGMLSDCFINLFTFAMLIFIDIVYALDVVIKRRSRAETEE